MRARDGVRGECLGDRAVRHVASEVAEREEKQIATSVGWHRGIGQPTRNVELRKRLVSAKLAF